MNIRVIQQTDALAFAQLCKEIDESGFMLYEPGERVIDLEKEEKRIENFLNDDRSIILVAEDDEKLIGYIVAIGGSVKRTRHSANLVLGVKENYRGRGVASRLFESLFAWAKEKRFTRLELSVIKDNVKAVNLYRKMGFIIEGEKVHSLIIDGKPVNEYYLYKLLK
ncbi:GNAT family N-acetyltransferase [Heyndrickxia sporothermodurans]|uniref:GNAT family N-acetyltransferase n=1 Tax=Heyndrickxia sporothermodurans TaxID=46224 RepID=UPI000D38EC66|nr:GNAT family N-acetyltransferase [Heyndrickxia sporothermodurans]PTY80617.1 GNAT family N-acetyltransferase [Heyndrickxia sporothermodurans]